MAKKNWLLPTRLIARFPATQKPAWMLEAALIGSLIRVLRALPIERAAGLGERVFRLLAPSLPVAAKIDDNLRIAFPDLDRHGRKRLTRRICANLGIAAVELTCADKICAEWRHRVDFVAEDDLDMAAFRNQPAVFVGAHIDAWQIGSFVGLPQGLAISSAYAPEKNPYLERFFFRLRDQLPNRFISRDGCMRELTRELRRGGCVGLITDTRLADGIPLEFFGVPMYANTAAARLAIRNRAPLHPVRVERLPKMRYRLTVCRAIRPNDSTASVNEQARQMTADSLAVFEEWIRERPEQWMCFSRRWPPAVYADTGNR